MTDTLASLERAAGACPASKHQLLAPGGPFADGMLLQRGDSTLVGVWALSPAPRSLSASRASMRSAGRPPRPMARGRRRPRRGDRKHHPERHRRHDHRDAARRRVWRRPALWRPEQHGLRHVRRPVEEPDASRGADEPAPLRFFFQEGSGPYGGAGGRGCPVTVAGEQRSSITTARRWFKANATNSGGYSAVCMLTAQRLYEALGRAVPSSARSSRVCRARPSATGRARPTRAPRRAAACCGSSTWCRCCR